MVFHYVLQYSKIRHIVTLNTKNVKTFGSVVLFAFGGKRKDGLMIEWWLEKVTITRAEVAIAIGCFILACVFEVLYLQEREKRRQLQNHLNQK